MRVLIVWLLVLLIPSFALAADVTLAWDAPPDPDGVIKGYVICEHPLNKVYPDDSMCVDVGNVTQWKHTGLAYGAHYWVAKSYGDIMMDGVTQRMYSDPSNEVSVKLLPTKPPAPRGLLIKAIDHAI